jgi:hypothetical protein
VRRIPRGMPATRHLRRELKAAAEQMVADERESLPRGRARRLPTLGRLRTVVVTAFALLLLTVSARGVRDFVADVGPRGAGPRTPTVDQPVPPGLQPSLATARDPIERRYPWGVRAYASRHGNCVLSGRLLGGQLGRLQDGKFAALGKTMVGHCGSLPRSHIVLAVRDYYDLSGGRTVLYGITDRRVASLGLFTGAGAGRRAVNIADDNSFVTVRLGAQAFRGQTLRIAFTDGRVRTVALEPGPPRHRTDPHVP